MRRPCQQHGGGCEQVLLFTSWACEPRPTRREDVANDWDWALAHLGLGHLYAKHLGPAVGITPTRNDYSYRADMILELWHDVVSVHKCRFKIDRWVIEERCPRDLSYVFEYFAMFGDTRDGRHGGIFAYLVLLPRDP